MYISTTMMVNKLYLYISQLNINTSIF